MSFTFSALTRSFEESATLALSARAKSLAAAGQSIVNMGVGEPDRVTDSAIIEAAFSAARAGATKYTAVGGQPSLRAAIAQRLTTDYGSSFSPQEVIVSAGGKQSIYHFLQSVIEPGDEVIIVSPYWVSFPEMVKLVGGKPVILRGKKMGRPTAEELRAVITSRTKVFILNSPSNPSGQVLSSAETTSLLDELEPTKAWLMTDDTYYTLVYGQAKWQSALALRPEWKSRTCVIGSSSKTYAMTGWRLGWAVGPKELISQMTKLQSQVTSNACSLAQAAVEFALTQAHDRVVADLKGLFESRRNRLLQGLQQISGLDWVEPEGAFYAFVSPAKALGGRLTVTDFCYQLLEKHGVCVIPGEAFGEPDWCRLSYALSESEMDEGLKRINHALRS
jgi:aspartate aminotransferase